METLANDTTSLPMLLAYGLLILLYLLILKLLLNFLQQMGDKHRTQKSVIDVDIHNTMTPQVESSMHTFDVYSIAIVIAKGGITATAMAAIIVLLVLKVGILATALLILIVIVFLWGLNHWLNHREKVGTIREIRRYVQKSGSVGSVVMLSIALVVVLFGMILLQ